MKTCLKLTVLIGLLAGGGVVQGGIFSLHGDDSSCGSCAAANDACGGCADDCGCGGLLGGSCLDDLFGDGCGSGCSLDGLLQSGDPCFNDFISPITNPIYFQDPRIQTEARFIFLNHWFPSQLGDGDAQLYALQLRAAITEDLSIIATKDGYLVSDNPLLDDGWADVSLGLQYNLFKDPGAQTLLSAGVVFDLPVGTPRALQGNGDGEFHLFVTGGTEIAEDWHLISGTGFILPSNRDAQSQIWYWSNHVDHQLGDSGLYLLGEVNWFHWLNGADEFPVPVEGLDYANLGSVGVGGNNIVTGAVGMKYKPTDNQELGVAIEFPLTDRRDILDQRLTFDWIVRY